MGTSRWQNLMILISVGVIRIGGRLGEHISCNSQHFNLEEYFPFLWQGVGAVLGWYCWYCTWEASNCWKEPRAQGFQLTWRVWGLWGADCKVPIGTGYCAMVNENSCKESRSRNILLHIDLSRFLFRTAGQCKVRGVIFKRITRTAVVILL